MPRSMSRARASPYSATGCAKAGAAQATRLARHWLMVKVTVLVRVVVLVAEVVAVRVVVAVAVVVVVVEELL